MLQRSVPKSSTMLSRAQVVQELLGHSTISLTLDTYSHVAPAPYGSPTACV